LSSTVVEQHPDLVASHFTLTGSGFGEPPRHGFAERCRAASDAGFGGIGLHADDVSRTVAGGMDVAEMRRVLADTGLRVVEIEFLGGWAFDVDVPALARTVAGIEAVAGVFGGWHVTAGEFRPAPAGGLDLDAAAARLGALAARLGAHGLRTALEAFPWSALPDAGTAIAVLRRAASPYAGLMIDVWHYFNGGAGPELLDGLPPGAVAAVQLNDGPLVHDDFLRHARAERRLPGEGDLDVVGLVRAVQRTGFAGPWCVEVNTPEFRALPVGEAAKRAMAAATDVLAAARG
jgi:sugar phosphate isomerase/epimerase